MGTSDVLCVVMTFDTVPRFCRQRVLMGCDMAVDVTFIFRGNLGFTVKRKIGKEEKRKIGKEEKRKRRKREVMCNWLIIALSSLILLLCRILFCCRWWLQSSLTLANTEGVSM